MFQIMFLCFINQVLGAEVLFASSFTTNDFTTNEGWMVYSRNHNDFGIEAYDNQNYIGLNVLSGWQLKGDGITKVFYSLPPHYAIRVKGTILIKIISSFDYTEGVMKIDGKTSALKSLVSYLNQKVGRQIYQKSYFDNYEFHYATSVYIQVYFGQSYPTDDLSLGFRDFYLYVLTCPNGCDSCDNAVVCNDWKLQYRSLINQQFLTFDTEGWYMSAKFNNLDKNSYISIKRCQYQSIDILFFGLGRLNQQFQKTIQLPLHYKVKISYFQLLYNILSQYKYNWMAEVDGNIIITSTFGVKTTLPPHICGYDNDPEQISGEILENVSFEASHNKQFLNFATYPTDYIFSDQSIRWGIRDFEIYIKPCHSSCIYSCKGPGPSGCQDDILYTQQLFYSIFTETTFTNNDGWQMIQPTQLSTLRCMESLVSTTTKFFQGNNHFQKVFYLTQPHTTISISFTLFQIDKFTGEKLFVLVDDVEVRQVSLPAVTISDGLPLCSVDDDYDKRIIVNITNIAHSQNTLIVQMYTNQIVTATGFWGIRNFVLTLDRRVISTEFASLNLVSDDWKDWVYTPTTFSLSLCSSKTLFGGVSQLDQTSSLRKIIKNIPQHEKIKIEFKIIVKAPANEDIQLTFSIDGKQVFLRYIKTQTMLYCDASTNSNIFTIEEIYEHSNSQIFLQISTSNSNSIVYTWGIRDFKLSHYQRYIYSG